MSGAEQAKHAERAVRAQEEQARLFYERCREEDVLRHINVCRAALGLQPRSGILPGIRGHSARCAIRRSITTSLEATVWVAQEETTLFPETPFANISEQTRFQHSAAVKSFIQDYDMNRLPDRFYTNEFSVESV